MDISKINIDMSKASICVGNISYYEFKLNLETIALLVYNENEHLYSFSIKILKMYAKKYINLIVYLLSSFLTFKVEFKNIGINLKEEGMNYFLSL